MRYFTDENRTILKGEASFAHCQVTQRDCRFEVKTNARPWRFQADTKEEANIWIDYLNVKH